MSQALSSLKAREEYESQLLSNESTLETYKDYIKFEMDQKDPARVQCLFERAVTDHCLEVS